MNNFNLGSTAVCDICGKHRSSGNHTRCNEQRKRDHAAGNKTRKRAPRRIQSNTADYITKIVA